MSALSELVIMFEGRDYPVDTAEWWWSDEELCQRFFGFGEDEWREAISRQVDGVGRPEKWAQVMLVVMAMNHNDDPPANLKRFAKFNTNGAFIRPANPDAFAAAVDPGDDDGADADPLAPDTSSAPEA